MPGSQDSDTPPEPARRPQAVRPLRLAYATGASQFGELHVPAAPGPYPVAIVIHGGFWRTPYAYTLMTGIAEDLARRGIAAWNIEYRRLGDPQGGWPATLLDVAAAADFLAGVATRHQLDLRRVAAIGHSAGGHLALWLAARPRIPHGSVLAPARAPLALAGAISLAGVVDLRMGERMRLGNGAVAELLGGSFSAVPERYATASPAALLPLRVRQVLVHGTADDRVPFEMSRSYSEAARAAGERVQLITLPGVDHFALIDASSQAWAISLRSIQAALSA
jgi:acetyl esterase/lipase